MSDARQQALRYASEHRNRFIGELIEFLTIPTISTDPAHRADMLAGAGWVESQLKSLGMDRVEIFPSPPSHPVVYGQNLAAGPGAPTVLVYGHYDVQPAEPLDKWDNPPFEPAVRQDHLFARGSTDMKGQVMATLKAVEAIIRTSELPVNLKCLIEGEEEVGSPHLGTFIEANKSLLACDFAFNPDTGMIAADLPTITYALRGLAYFELRIYGPRQDLHSGLYGGVVHNPAQVLCDLISGMHNAQGQVTLPGFYDSVRPLGDEERSELARLPMDEGFYLEQTGAPALWGEHGYSPVERVGGRPTLEVNGLFSGFIGEGSKTVLPAYAMAKISTRLVPDQDPSEVFRQMHRYLESHTPATVRWELINIVGGMPSLSDRHSSAVGALERALETVWGVRPVYKREGGSVPVVAHFQELLGVESVNTGFSLPRDGAHGPNEKLHLPTWSRGLDSVIHFFFNLAETA